MGRTGKATNIKGQPGKDKHSVSDDTISKLMNDFNCASLLTNTTGSATEDHRLTPKETAHANCCEEIVSSLKHFHLKTPVNKRTRLKEKRNFQRKTKVVLDNKYNLSVAAINSQKSVVWPGKLNCLSKRTDSDVIIRPSRLSVSGTTDKPLSSFFSSIQTSSSEEKARIAATLNNQNLSNFGNIKEKDKSTHLSFSKLCNKNLKYSKQIVSASGVTFGSSCSTHLPESIKQESYRNHQQNFNLSINHNHSCSPADFSGHHEVSKNKISLDNSSQQQKVLCHSCSLTHTKECVTPTYQANHRISIPNQSSSVNSAVSGGGIAPERSCSEEMRMEESNVTELASYFEDLLHIPRKMSVMAEMMYA